MDEHREYLLEYVKFFHIERKEYQCVFWPKLLSLGYEIEVVPHCSVVDSENTLVLRHYYILSP